MGRNHLDTLRDASLRYSTSNSIAPESPRSTTASPMHSQDWTGRPLLICVPIGR
ncbi:hypothetical protein E4U51_005262 [Claviceps purpurea]|nr:hypothetical protein E4U51_005262 [Claviceps purpurea]